MQDTDRSTQRTGTGSTDPRRPQKTTKTLYWTALITVLTAPSLALAYTPTTTLGQLMNTELRQRTGDAVQTACGQLGALGSRTTLQDDLFDRCGNMVHNANELTSGTPTAKTLGLDTAAELSAVVQTVATEELAATKTMSTEIASGQANSAIARLQSVRSGIRIGIAGLDAGSFDALAQMEPRARAELGSRGGAAGDASLGKWGYFISGHYGFGDRDTTDRENGFDHDRVGLTAGIDYQISQDLIVGALVSYDKSESDFDESAAVPGGGVDADAWGIGLYGTYYKDNYYVDGLIGYNRVDYDIDRKILLPLGTGPGAAVGSTTDIVRTASGDTDSDDFTLSLGGGMDFTRGNMTYGPFARISYVDASVDGYSESGALGLNLTVDDVEWDSLTTVIGGRIGASFSQDWGVVVPQARLGWVHEFQNDSQRFSAFYTVDPNRNQLIGTTDDPDRNYFELGIGVSAVFRGDTQAFLDYQTLLGHSEVSDHVVTVGMRSAF